MMLEVDLQKRTAQRALVWPAKLCQPAGRLLLCATAFVTMGWDVSASAAVTYAVFDAPGALNTYASAINGGVLTGDWQDSSNVFHGYVRGSDGTITEFDPTFSISTVPVSINSTGAIVGFY